MVAIVNQVTVSEGPQLSFQGSDSFPLGVCPEEKLLDWMIDQFLISLETSICFSLMAA